MNDKCMTQEQFKAAQLVVTVKGDAYGPQHHFLASTTYDVYLQLRWALKQCKGYAAVCTAALKHDVYWKSRGTFVQSAQTDKVVEVEDVDTEEWYCAENKDHLVISEGEFEDFEEVSA